jgi:hypothetical protein
LDYATDGRTNAVKIGNDNWRPGLDVAAQKHNHAGAKTSPFSAQIEVRIA